LERDVHTQHQANKLITKNSTEAKLVAIYDAMGPGTVDLTFPSGSRDPSTCYDNLPRQNKHDSTILEWVAVKQ